MENLSALFATFGLAIAICLAFVVVIYVLYCKAWSKILKMYGYENTWMAWIPYLQYYALADAAFKNKEKVKFFPWEMSAFVFKFWWVVALINVFWPSNIMSYAVVIAQTLALGTVFAHIFAKAEDKTYDETKFFALVAGFFPIIAMIKFFSYDKNKNLGKSEDCAERTEMPATSCDKEDTL